MKIKDCIKYRNVWMGIAIIWVIIYHLQINWNVGVTALNKVFHIIEKQGYFGVDIFFFASGVGCYYSLSKDSNPGRFIKRRLYRLMPVYIPLVILWYSYLIIVEHNIDWITFIRTVFCVTNFTGGRGINWYLTAIWIAYFMAPFLKSWIDDCNSKRGYLVLVVMMFLFSVAFWYTGNHIRATARYPLFGLGMICAKNDNAELKGAIRNWIFAVGIIAEIYMVYSYRFDSDILKNLGMFWYPGFLFIPALLLGISILCKQIESFVLGRYMMSIFSIAGKYSFELFLTHIILNDRYDDLVERGIIKWENKYIIPFFVATIMLSLVLVWIKSAIYKCMDRISMKSVKC